MRYIRKSSSFDTFMVLSRSGFYNTERCNGNFHFVYFDPKLGYGKKAWLGLIQFLHLKMGQNLANRDRI